MADISLQVLVRGQAVCRSGHLEFDSSAVSESMVANMDGEIVSIKSMGNGRIRLIPNREIRYTISFGVGETVISNITVENNSLKINDNWSLANNILRNHCLNNTMARVPLIESDVLHIQLDGEQFDTIGTHNMLRLRFVTHSPDWIGLHFTPTELLEVCTNPNLSMTDIEELYHDIFYHQFNEETKRAQNRQNERRPNA